MTRKYAVTNIATGVSVTVDTKQEAVALFWKNIIDETKKIYGNSMYMIIDQDEAGKTHIYNQDNTDLINYQFTEEQIITLYNEGQLSIPVPPDDQSIPDSIISNSLLSFGAPTTIVNISPISLEASTTQNDLSDN